MPLHCSKEKKRKKKTKSLYSQKIKEKENKNCLCPKCPITKDITSFLSKLSLISHVTHDYVTMTDV